MIEKYTHNIEDYDLNNLSRVRAVYDTIPGLTFVRTGTNGTYDWVYYQILNTTHYLRIQVSRNEITAEEYYYLENLTGDGDIISFGGPHGGNGQTVVIDTYILSANNLYLIKIGSNGTSDGYNKLLLAVARGTDGNWYTIYRGGAAGLALVPPDGNTLSLEFMKYTPTLDTELNNIIIIPASIKDTGLVRVKEFTIPAVYNCKTLTENSFYTLYDGRQAYYISNYLIIGG